MRSVFLGKNASLWLMNQVEHIVVGTCSKQFSSFREGDIAFTLQRSSNSFGQFLLLTELKVGGSRRSVIILEGLGKKGWRVFGLELRKMLNPSQYAVAGTVFIPQVHRHNLEAQQSRTFAEVVQGFHGRVEDGKKIKQLSFTVKGKTTQLGEEKSGVNQKVSDAKVGVSPAGKLVEMKVRGVVRREQCINEEAVVGEQNLDDVRRRSPGFSLNAIALEKGKKYSAVRSPC
ncbi:hypothetical protein SO802_010694 [Lithocarpus litseifolius]|uniref:Uncharacterized protein n=1 Tax=Lithocarpus litseifolius TaxID=425828 RepID=A0AAW2DFF3_9ROSI